jgi:hypothetical protein
VARCPDAAPAVRRQPLNAASPITAAAAAVAAGVWPGGGAGEVLDDAAGAPRRPPFTHSAHHSGVALTRPPS